MEEMSGMAEDLLGAKITLENLSTWSEDIPDEFINSGHGGYHRHKFRRIWFQGVLSNLKLIAFIYNDDELLQAVEGFIEYLNKKDRNIKNTHEEIERANQLIRKGLEKCQDIG